MARGLATRNYSCLSKASRLLVPGYKAADQSMPRSEGACGKPGKGRHLHQVWHPGDGKVEAPFGVTAHLLTLRTGEVKGQYPQERGRPVKKAEQGSRVMRTDGRRLPTLSGSLFPVEFFALEP
mgnify:CR=1 FL=1|jgi:hypothetical protein